MDRHRNPYTPGAGARQPLLAGREADLADVTVALEWLGAGRSARGFVLDGLLSERSRTLSGVLDPELPPSIAMARRTWPV